MNVWQAKIQVAEQELIMDERSREIVKFQLKEEIARIEASVSRIGPPRLIAERALIARYGKLLLLSQALLGVLGRPAAGGRAGVGPRRDPAVPPSLARSRTRPAFRRLS